MKKKILITIFIIITIIESIIPIKVNAFTDQYEIVSVPAKIENKQSALDDMDVAAGIILEPAVELISFILDAVMTIMTSIMTQENLEFVMSTSAKNLPGEASVSYTISDMSKYQNALGDLTLRYPYFTYSPEEIFQGNIDLLDINFLDDSNSDESWQKIRSVISQWYKVLRMIAIIALLSILIYTGIKIIISSNTKDKAKYKELIINWFMAVVLVFSLHYIMAFILEVVEEIMGLLRGLSGIVEVHAGGTTFKTNLLGLARFRLQQVNFTDKVLYLILYTALVVYTFKFTFVYFKRVLKMAFLTMISPIVAATYPIDKMNGQAKGFQMWLKEFLYNVLLQPLHYILYYILVTTSLTLAVRNPIYAVVALMFMSQAEKLLKKIFGFEKATAGTVGGLTGAFATGALTSGLMNAARNPLHPFSGGKGNGKGGSANQRQLSYSDDDIPNDVIDDINPENFIDTAIFETMGASSGAAMLGSGVVSSSIGTNNITNLAMVNDFIGTYRDGLSSEQLGELSFEDGDPRSINTLLRQILQCQTKLQNGENTPEQIEQLNERLLQLQSLLQNRIMANESGFSMNGIPLQYMDGDTRSTSDLMDEIIRLRELTQNGSLSEIERNKYATEARRLQQIVKRRMSENQFIESQGGAQALLQQQGITLSLSPNEIPATISTNAGEEKQGIMDKIKNAHITKGITHVGKTIIKPAWDSDKSTSYNAKRLVGKLAKGVTGTAVGITAATVQAGISITDGKYNPAEGVATFAAGYAGVSALTKGGKGIKQTYDEAANSAEDGKSMKKYSEQWYNRDDIIESYNREFPGQGKEMRQRAVDNYVSRGITDFKEQKQAMKFAELLKKERGLDQEEADRIAAATLRYKQSLSQNSDYSILYDQEKRGKYLDTKVDTYSGASSKDSVRRVHEEFIQNVIDFNRANR